MKNSIILLPALFLYINAEAQSLFTEYSSKNLPTEKMRIESVNNFTSREFCKENYHLGQFDLSVLESDVIHFQIPGQANIELVRLKQSQFPNIWRGESKNPWAQMRLTWRGSDSDWCSGSIMFKSDSGISLYEFVSFDKHTGLIVELDYTKFPSEEPSFQQEVEYNHDSAELIPPDADIPNVEDEPRSTSRNSLNGTYGCNLRVLVAYTVTASNHIYMSDGKTIREWVDENIEITNYSYANSGINHQVELAALVPVNYTTTGVSLNDHVNTFSQMSEIYTYRDLFAADVCILLHKDDSSFGCGQAFNNGTLNYVASEAFCVVNCKSTCPSDDYSFTHEIGHIQSARHDINTDPATTPYSYGHGYISPGNNWRTMMAYGSPCGGCPRLQYWSNPNINHPIDGLPMGNAITADNARVLNQTTPKVKTFRQPPLNLTVNSSALGDNDYVDAIAKNTVETSGEVEVSSGQQMDIRAGKQIRLKPGFHAARGSKFSAKITDVYDCPEPSTSKSFSVDIINELLASNEAEQAEWGQNVELSVSVYPNPVSNILNIEYNMPERDWLKVSILDMQGRVLKVYEEPRVKEKGYYSVTLSLDELISGLYFVQVTLPDSEKSKIARIIVQK